METINNIYMIGIKGTGMASLAILLTQMGKTVTGSDVLEEFPTDSVLKENNIKIVEGFKKENVNGDIDLVITTGAHSGLLNEEVSAAREKNIPVLTHAAALGKIMDLFKVKVAVCGTHGKTTVSAMIAFVMMKMGLKIGYHVGTSSFSGMSGGGFSGYDYFVTEADEYVNSKGTDETPRFMFLNPDIIVATNIDYDHPDVFSGLDEVKRVFGDFFNKLNPESGQLIYCKEDENLNSLASLQTLKNKYPYEFSNKSDLKLKIPGRHNLTNAVAVLELGKALEFDDSKTRKLLADFSGSKRRFEKIYEKAETILYDDYAHHPKEIEATIQAANELYPARRIIVIFQPHTYSRTHVFLDEFKKALSKADKALVTDIFASAREEVGAVSSQSLVNDHISYSPFSKLTENLEKILKKNDIIITMGAGSLYRLHSDIIEVVNKL